MDINKEALLLRIFISSTDKFKHSPLSEVIVFAAKRYGLSGATVLRGCMGYGGSSAISNVKFWEVTEKIPIVIEIVDVAEKINSFFDLIKPYLDMTKKGCIVTIEKASIIYYKTGKKD